MHPLVVSDTYMYEGFGNCLLVENGGRYHVLLAHMECLGYRCRIDAIRPMHANSRTIPCSYLSVVCILWLLMSFIGLLRGMGVNFFIAFNFHGALSKIVGGQSC